MSALPSNIDRFGALCGAACAGVTTALDMAATGGALTIGAAVVSAASTGVASLLERRSDAAAGPLSQAMARYLKTLDRAWKARERTADGKAINRAIADYLDNLDEVALPDDADMLAAGRDAAALAALMRRAAAARWPEWFADGALAAEALEAQFATAFTALFEDDAYEAHIAPAFRSWMVGTVRRIDATTQATASDVKELLALMRAEKAPDIDRARIERAALEEIAETVLAHAEGRNMTAAEIAAAVRERVANLIETVERLERTGNLPDPTETERRRIADLYRAGQFEAAETAQEALTDRELEEMDARRQRLSEDTARAARSAEDRYDYLRAATLWEKAARAHQGDPLERWRLTRSRAISLYQHGLEMGVNECLETAIALYRNDLLPGAPREERADDWAATQNNLGTALQTLGEREAGTARLEEAVAAYRDALKERSRDRVPLDWAMTQNNLGAALQTLGEREAGTARLEEAVAAYRDALEERTRDRARLEWATTQCNLGSALTILGRREAGAARLEEAVAAYRDALKEMPRDRVPLNWAATQNNLGNALLTLGERETGTARLEEAVTAYRDALKEWTRDRVPLGWAMSTGNQGVAMSILADRADDAAMAAAAVRQIEAAFEVMRDGGHAPHAAFYEARLPRARAVAARFARE